MPTRLCLAPRCPNPAVRIGRCQRHAKQRNTETHRNRNIYNSARWRHTRKRVLFEQPLCATEGCDAISTDVHHIVDLADGGDPWARTNLESLCHRCHARITRARMGRPD